MPELQVPIRIKRGLKANLPATGLLGELFLTTDEKALYASNGGAPFLLTSDLGIINAKSEGCVGDGRIVYLLQATAGSNAIASGIADQITTDDIGSRICLPACGANRADLWTTIASVVDSSNFTVTDNCGSDVDYFNNIIGFATLPGTDDTAALQAAITKACTEAKALYIPAGVYLISDQLTFPADTLQPIAIYGAGSEQTFLIAENPALAPPIGTSMIDFETFSPTDFKGFGIIGPSCASTDTPVNNGYIKIATLNAVVTDIFVAVSPSKYDIDVQNSFGIIFGVYCTRALAVRMDSTDLIGCQAGNFIFIQDFVGGTVSGCVAAGDNDRAIYCFNTDDGLPFRRPLTFQSCFALSGFDVVVTPVGFAVPNATYLNCQADAVQIGFLVGSDATLRDCSTGKLYFVEGHSFVISSGEFPFVPGIAYFSGQKIVDENGNIQTVTTPGIADVAPTWGTHVNDETTTGDVTFTCTQAPSAAAHPTRVKIDHCISDGLTAPESFGLWDNGDGTDIDYCFATPEFAYNPDPIDGGTF